MRKLILLIAVLFSAYANSFAQHEPCATDLFHTKKMKLDPAYAARFHENNKKIDDYIKGLSTQRTIDANTVYTIPVVFHVIHTGGAVGTIYNPNDATLNLMLDKLNDDFANANTFGVDLKIQFALAQRTPDCNSTGGIERINGNGVTGYTANGVNSENTNGADEVAVKDLSRWSTDNYINIWIVNKIDGADGTSGQFTAGYAYFPGAGSDVDGVIMLATQVNGDDITLTHEIGHYFNLFHTFEGDDGGCPIDNDCASDGDMVCDTPPHERSPFNCPSGSPTCSGASAAQVVRNFMDYSNCQDRYTSGQKTRARAALATLRPALMSSMGATAASGSVTSIASPTIVNSGNMNFMGPNSFSFDENEVVSGTYSHDQSEYADYSCTQQYAVTQGSTYAIAVKTQTNAQNVRIYIDYNNDGDFVDAGETAYSHTGSTATETHSGNITIPSSGTAIGLVRMRVWADHGSGFNGPTGSIKYGQAEDYALIITEGESCPDVTASISSSTNVSCNGGANGAATVSASGGSGFTHLWSPGGATTATISGKTAGTYTCTVTNSCANSDAVSVTINQPSAMSSSISSQTNVSCNGLASGAATVSVSGGTGSKTFAWSPSGGTAASISGRTAGNYTCTITDANGCTKTQAVTITQPTAITTSISSQTNVSTNGGSDGAATISVSGGTPAYTYNWSPSGGTSASASGLSAGIYTCNVTDVSSCTAQRIVTITQPSSNENFNAGPDQSVCNVKTNLAAVGTGTWSIISGIGGSINSLNSATSQFNGVAGNTYVLRWAAGLEEDLVTIEFKQFPSAAFAGFDKTYANAAPTLTIALNASSPAIGSGMWTIISGTGGSFADATNAKTNFTGSAAISYTLRWTVSNSCNSTYDDVVITIKGASTSISSPSCGTTLIGLTHQIYCTNVGGATNYQFRWVENGITLYATTGTSSNLTYASKVVGIQFNKTYQVSVRAYVNGVWGSWSADCELTTPASPPNTNVLDDDMNITLASWTTPLTCKAVSGAQYYNWFWDDGAGFTNSVNTVSTTSYAKSVAGLTPNTTYSVSVKVRVNGTWGNYSTICSITTPNTAQAKISNNGSGTTITEITLFPNPCNGTFNLQLSGITPMDYLHIELIDMLGKTLSIKSISDLENDIINFNDMDLPKGVYSLKINLNDTVEVKRLVVE